MLGVWLANEIATLRDASPLRWAEADGGSVRAMCAEVTRPPALAPVGRTITDFPVQAARAIELLCAPGAMLQLPPDDARHVVASMRLLSFPPGATLLHEGDRPEPDHLMLLLSGEVSVDTAEAGQPDAVAIAVLGPGDVIGEMSVLDGAPRSASCVAASSVSAAVLSRAALMRLIDEQPQAAARLMVLIAQRMSERMRGLGLQLQMYARVVAEQQDEIERLKTRT